MPDSAIFRLEGRTSALVEASYHRCSGTLCGVASCLVDIALSLGAEHIRLDVDFPELQLRARFSGSAASAMRSAAVVQHFKEVLGGSAGSTRCALSSDLRHIAAVSSNVRVYVIEEGRVRTLTAPTCSDDAASLTGLPTNSDTGPMELVFNVSGLFASLPVRAKGLMGPASQRKALALVDYALFARFIHAVGAARCCSLTLRHQCNTVLVSSSECPELYERRDEDILAAFFPSFARGQQIKRVVDHPGMSDGAHTLPNDVKLVEVVTCTRSKSIAQPECFAAYLRPPAPAPVLVLVPHCNGSVDHGKIEVVGSDDVLCKELRAFSQAATVKDGGSIICVVWHTNFSNSSDLRSVNAAEWIGRRRSVSVADARPTLQMLLTTLLRVFPQYAQLRTYRGLREHPTSVILSRQFPDGGNESQRCDAASEHHQEEFGGELSNTLSAFNQLQSQTLSATALLAKSRELGDNQFLFARRQSRHPANRSTNATSCRSQTPPVPPRKTIFKAVGATFAARSVVSGVAACKLTPTELRQLLGDRHHVQKMPRVGCMANGGVSRADISAPLRFVAQWQRKFLLCMLFDGRLLCADQHAVHERLRLEYFQARWSSYLGCSAALPSSFDVTDIAAVQMIHRHGAALHTLGWRFGSAATTGSLLVLGAPTLMIEGFAYAIDAADDLLETLYELERSSSSRLMCPAAFTRILVSRSCRGAVMFGDYLDAQSAAALLLSLKHVAQFDVCSHGRTSMSLLASAADATTPRRVTLLSASATMHRKPPVLAALLTP